MVLWRNKQEKKELYQKGVKNMLIMTSNQVLDKLTALLVKDGIQN